MLDPIPDPAAPGIEPVFDADGYPTDEWLSALEGFEGSPAVIASVVERAWRNGWVKVEDTLDQWDHPHKKVSLITGGWSGNESIIGALEHTMFWFVGWQTSTRGGLHEFEFNPGIWDASLPALKPATATAQASGDKQPDANIDLGATVEAVLSVLRDEGLRTGVFGQMPPWNPQGVNFEVLREVLIKAVCPIVCRGQLDGGENWHQICLDRADKAMQALKGEEA